MILLSEEGLDKQDTNVNEFKEEQLKDPRVRAEYDRLQPKYDKIEDGIK